MRQDNVGNLIIITMQNILAVLFFLFSKEQIRSFPFLLHTILMIITRTFYYIKMKEFVLSSSEKRERAVINSLFFCFAAIPELHHHNCYVIRTSSIK